MGRTQDISHSNFTLYRGGKGLDEYPDGTWVLKLVCAQGDKDEPINQYEAEAILWKDQIFKKYRFTDYGKCNTANINPLTVTLM